MKGLEMMVNSALSGMGLDPKMIGELAEGLQNTLVTLLRQNEVILRNQRKIMRELNISFEEPKDDGSSDGGNDGGNSGGTIDHVGDD